MPEVGGNSYSGITASGSTRGHFGDVKAETYNNYALYQEQKSKFHKQSQEQRDTQLLRAAQLGHGRRLELLLAAGADFDHTTDQNLSALHLAVQGGHLDCVRRLLDAGADPEIEDAVGMIPWQYATDNDMYAILAEYGARNRNNQVAAHPQIQVEHKRRDVDRVPNHISAHFDIESSATHTSISPGESPPQLERNALSLEGKALPPNFDHTSIHVSRLQGSVMAENYSTGTSLPFAAKAGHLKNLPRLLDSDAAAEMCGAPHTSALHEAAAADRVEAVNLLLDRGFDINLQRNGPSQVKGLADQGTTALHVAVACDSRAVIKLLICRGADLLAKDASGKTPLHTAVGYRQVAALRILSSNMNEADLDVGDMAGNTALETICTSLFGHAESMAMVQALLSSGAKPFTEFSRFATSKLHLIPLLLNSHESRERQVTWTRELDKCLDSWICDRLPPRRSVFEDILFNAVCTLLQYGLDSDLLKDVEFRLPISPQYVACREYLQQYTVAIITVDAPTKPIVKLLDQREPGTPEQPRDSLQPERSSAQRSKLLSWFPEQPRDSLQPEHPSAQNSKLLSWFGR